jgi:hypothetical protein
MRVYIDMAQQMIRPAEMEKSRMHKLFVAVLVFCVVSSAIAQGSGAAVQTATTVLSSAQLQHLRSAPVQLLPAPGGGNVLNLVSIVGQYKSGGSVYSLGDGGCFTVALGTERVASLTSAGFIDKPASQIQFNGASAVGTESDMENKPLMIFNNGSGEWTEGDGSVVVTVYYTIVGLQ